MAVNNGLDATAVCPLSAPYEGGVVMRPVRSSNNALEGERKKQTILLPAANSGGRCDFNLHRETIPN